MADQPILAVENLTIALPSGGDRATAVRNEIRRHQEAIAVSVDKMLG